MTTFVTSLIVFGLAILAMAIGAILARKPLKGTCGGLNTLSDRFGGKAPCEVCGGDPAKQPSDCSDRRERDAKSPA